MIDEFGTGTEPQLGGSIAEATLEHLNSKSAFGLITTHYTNLKLAADKNPGLINGAMLFDSNEMQPLYKLQIGKPGSSFAFEIAKKIGFPNHILNRAKKKSGGKHIRFDQQLQQLETDKILLQKQKEQIDYTDDKLSQTVEKYTNLLSNLEKSKKQIIAEAKKEAFSIIANSNKIVEKTIREIKEAQANKQITKEIRDRLESSKDELKEDVARTSDKKKEKRLHFPEDSVVKRKKKKTLPETKAGEKEKNTSERTIEIGNYVQVKDTDIVGELISVSGNDVLVNVNDVKLKTNLSKLIRAKKPKTKTVTNTSSYSGLAKDINQKAANFKISLDLRGMRAEEALSELQHYVDDAMILSIKEISILHGKGNGILRPIIREYLQSIDGISNYSDAPINQGGAGITKVYFD